VLSAILSFTYDLLCVERDMKSNHLLYISIITGTWLHVMYFLFRQHMWLESSGICLLQ